MQLAGGGVVTRVGLMKDGGHGTQYRPRLPLLSGHYNRPVFDCLVDAKMEREGAGDLVISMVM